ncbi:Immediate early response 2 protein [Crotalus adamanteus]|uniref:Immediate early response 2 protein n=1 Tax=Crotalus adamanteus TaxID=8729 RepID=A0AAW1BB94_CROAD
MSLDACIPKWQQWCNQCDEPRGLLLEEEDEVDGGSVGNVPGPQLQVMVPSLQHLEGHLMASASQQGSLGKIGTAKAGLVPSKKAKLAEEEAEWQFQWQEGPFPSLA